MDNPSDITIDKARPEDALAINQVFYQTWLDTYIQPGEEITKADIDDFFKPDFTEESLKKFEAKLASMPDNRSFFVARDGGRVVGVCLATKDESFNELDSIYVLPEWQGNGIGGRLWKATKGFFDPTKDIIVKVVTYNKGAIAFYEKLGFVDTGKRFNDPRCVFLSGAKMPEMEMILKTKEAI